MTGMVSSRTIRFPTEEEVTAAFERYTTAVGKVAHSWNYLHEKLGQLFVVVLGAERALAMSAWYSIDSDRLQRKILMAIIHHDDVRAQ